MKNPQLKKLTTKNLLATLQASDGVSLWQHLYVVDQDGNEFDATAGGETSCALFVSSILAAFGLIDVSHATVATTIIEMKKAGWHEVDAPRPGAVVEYGEYESHTHIGFVLEGDRVISNNSKLLVPTIHGFQMEDGRNPISYYWHDDLDMLQ